MTPISSIKVKAKIKSIKDSFFPITEVDMDSEKQQNMLSLFLGAMIVIVVGILIFNYFTKGVH